MKKSTQLIIMGSVYLILGLFALMFATASTLASVLTLAGVLFVVGVIQIVYGIQGRKSGQLWPHVTLGCLAVACSVLIARNPLANTMGLTLLVGFLLLAGGFARVLGAIIERSTGWGYYFLNGVLSLLLGAIIIYTFPASAFWTIGTFVAVDLIFGGISLIGLGYAFRKARKELESTVQSMLPESYEEMEFHDRHERRLRNDRGNRDSGADQLH